MAKETPATRALAAAGVPFLVVRYDYDPAAASIGLAAAEALKEPPSRVLKTLMVLLDGKPARVVLASDQTLSMKALAAVAGVKAASMMAPEKAERLTGYKVGGISPIGSRQPAPTFIDRAILDEPYVFVNGGQRGLQLRLPPTDLANVTNAVMATLTA